ncbi:MAG: Gfo/Idh/MocA family oxidoreductase [Phycisphaeraceae bacterium]|nr:Gfo/Idh/MocA family oxidoreductase [Phycisphaeraceae bacterium]
MSSTQRIGMIGLDTSHVIAFCRLLMDQSDPHYIPGFKVSAAWAGGSRDFDKSWSRIEGFTRELKEKYGVPMLETPRQVAEQCDLVLMTAVDGRTHQELFAQIAPVGRPTFIDKPLSVSVAGAEAIFAMADKHHVVLSSSSSLRFNDEFVEALRDDELGPIVAIDVFGPLEMVDAMPGYLWYGVHGIEMMVAAMGVGCESLQVVKMPDRELLICRWGGNRTAVYHGTFTGTHAFAAVIRREKGVQMIDIAQARRPFYAGLLEAITSTLLRGKPTVDRAQMLEVMRVMELGNAARA